jgi:hypothetical protein
VTQRIVVENGTDWLTPLATLLAVIAGGAISFLVQARLSRRREADEAKAAARVVAGELSMVASRIKDMVVDDPRWFTFDDFSLPRWAEQQGVLARELTPEDWDVVSQSALELRWFDDGMKRAVAPGGPHEGERVWPLGDEGIKSMRKGWENATKAYNALAPLAEIDPEPGLLHEQLPAVGGG